MTVASLWKVLDNADCGKAVGENELTNRNAMQREAVHPWNQADKRPPSSHEDRTTLAVDLSIWICEGLASTALSTSHANPAIYLVYTRTVRLLQMGIKIIAVLEGKRRVRRSGETTDSFHKRRSGTAFWKACKESEEMLRTLGVPVVRAKAEGEALCAILNHRGIVDGVISNDGDCLLFGAKVVFTRFSIDNLEKDQIVRYDASNLRALIDKDQDEDGDFTEDDTDRLLLTREDLIAFALLTGSDLAGDGLPKVGPKKAIRFIRKCKRDFPLSKDTAAIDELKSWARTAIVASNLQQPQKKEKGRCCSHCSHHGDKRSHKKHGCEQCGTAPGEPCLRLSTEDGFRKSLRTKALAMKPKFDANLVLNAYMQPNSNQIPVVLAGMTCRTLRMGMPQLADMMQLPFVVKGLGTHASREFIKQSLPRLLARRTLFEQTTSSHEKRAGRIRLSRERPVPIEITRKLVQHQVPCFEVTWSVGSTMTDNDGNGVDGFVFSTVEEKARVEEKYPDLVKGFLEMEKENEKQGDAEVQRRRSFLLKILQPRDNTGAQADHATGGDRKGRKRARCAPKRADFFQHKRSGKKVPNRIHAAGEDVRKLMLFAQIATNEQGHTHKRDPIEEDSLTAATEGSISTKESIEKLSAAPRQRAIKHLLGDEAPIPTEIEIPACHAAQVKKATKAVRQAKVATRKLCQEEQPRKKRKVNMTKFHPKNLFGNGYDLAAEQVSIEPVQPRVIQKRDTPARHHGSVLPILTPGNNHTVSCNMGIHVRVTPLVTRRRVVVRPGM